VAATTPTRLEQIQYMMQFGNGVASIGLDDPTVWNRTRCSISVSGVRSTWRHGQSGNACRPARHIVGNETASTRPKSEPDFRRRA
jgi:hypothetical protein